jgi:signal transduction histidine kinase
MYLFGALSPRIKTDPMEPKPAPANSSSLDYQEIFQAVPELCLVLSVDLNPIVLDASAAYLEATGLRAYDLVGKQFLELFPLDSLKSSIEMVIGTKQKHEMPIQRYLTPGGDKKSPLKSDFDTKYWCTTQVPVLDRRGNLKCMIHQIEKAAIQTNDDFLSVASHELKTPLTSLMLRLQMVRKKLETVNDSSSKGLLAGLNDGLDVCFQQAKRLGGVIEEIVSVAGIQSGKIAYRFERVDLLAIVKQEVRDFSDQILRSKSTVAVYAEDPGLTEVWVICDAFRMEQVVLNLLSNAAKYGSGKPIRVTVGYQPNEMNPDGDAFVRVQDEGLGIPQEKRETIFERFERAIDKNEVSGLGLGLFIAREIITAHHGKIELRSEVGKGSTFTALIPVVPPPDATL